MIIIKWPNSKKFAFTIIDDTDNTSIDKIKTVYDLLEELKVFTTKTVWVYPSRDHFSGQALVHDDYASYVKKLQSKGFEIALHNIGSGAFTSEEIKKGLEIYKDILGSYPNIQVNHAKNPDNLYWGHNRFTFPLNFVMKFFYKNKRTFFGDDISSDYFWGVLNKKYIKYNRNLCFNGINTLRFDPYMPYRVKSKNQFSNFWFSSSDGHTVTELNNLLEDKNLDKLEKEGGACIVYTHFSSGFVDFNGEINEEFKMRLESLAKRDGWFVPAGVLLDYLLKQKSEKDFFISYLQLLRLDCLWFYDRINKKIKNKR